jgi:hypothetical protein
MPYNSRTNKGTPMTEDEIYQIFLDMMEERKAAKLLPWEPSRMDFAVKVAEIAYERGYNDGWKE